MSSTVSLENVSLENVHADHVAAFHRALSNILALPHVELTYAQILAGLSLKSVALESHGRASSIVADHVDLCPGVMDRVRAYRDQLDVLDFRFPPPSVQSFQETQIGTIAFSLRLIELLAVACHQIAVFLFRLDDGVHSHRQLEEELAEKRMAIPYQLFWMRHQVPPQTYFYNSFYSLWEQYPNGVADVVAYWAETRIFGGVLNFDRGESDLGCDGVYLHSDRLTGGATLFPPTEQQFEALKDFLSSSSSSPRPQQELPSALPILGSNQNRWRWRADVAFDLYHIYRDRHTKRINIPDIEKAGPSKQLRWRGSDFPETHDKQVVLNQFMARQQGEPVDEDALRMAEENIKYRTTPSSPVWRGDRPAKLERKAYWKPPYFF